MGIFKRRVIAVGLGLVVLAYLVQLPTPLRANTDALVYLTLAASFNDGHGFVWHNHKTHFPPGYPVIVARLERLGFASSAGLIVWNYIMMTIAACSGIWLLKRWLNLSQTMAMFLSLMYLLGWATIRCALLPGSETTYIAISFLCLQCLNIAETAEGKARWAWWICAVLLTPMAMSVRLIGVVLLPAEMWTLIVMLWRRRSAPQISFAEWIGRHKTTAASLVVLAAMSLAALTWAVTHTLYFRENFSLMTTHGISNELIFTARQRLIELGSMFCNIPSKNVLESLHRPLAYAGVPCLAMVLFLLLRRVRLLTCIDAYLIAYVGLLMVWPYDADVRFWLPVQVLLFGLIARELIDLAARLPQRARSITTVSLVWIAIFAVLGWASIAWNTRLTYSGVLFGDRWDVYYFRDTYRLASRSGLPGDSKAVDPDLLPVLRRFGGRDFSQISPAALADPRARGLN